MTSGSASDRKYVLGNWKMNPTDAGENVRLAGELHEAISKIEGFGKAASDRSIVVGFAPIDLYVQSVGRVFAEKNSALVVGGQNCHDQDKGAYTGFTSCAALESVGARFVLVGHSERRQHGHETNESIGRVLHHLLHTHIAFPAVVLCVGETLEQRQAARTTATLDSQLTHVIEMLQRQRAKGVCADSLVVAYEPVWAIGTGVTPERSDVEKAVRYIKQRFADAKVDVPPVLYGGSVNASNCAELAAVAQVDGFLVGGASLKVGEFPAIVRSVLDSSTKQ